IADRLEMPEQPAAIPGRVHLGVTDIDVLLHVRTSLARSCMACRGYRLARRAPPVLRLGGPRPGCGWWLRGHAGLGLLGYLGVEVVPALGLGAGGRQAPVPQLPPAQLGQ